MVYVPNRGGSWRSQERAATDIEEARNSSMYAHMGYDQLKAVHEQATANPHIEKYAARVKYTTAELARRSTVRHGDNGGSEGIAPSKNFNSEVRHGDAGGGGSITPSKNFKPSTWHG